MQINEVFRKSSQLTSRHKWTSPTVAEFFINNEMRYVVDFHKTELDHEFGAYYHHLVEEYPILDYFNNLNGYLVSMRLAIFNFEDSDDWDRGWGITGTGNAFKVFATLTEIIREFVEQKQPEYITFSAKEPSRQRLYNRWSKTLAGNKEVYKIMARGEAHYFIEL